MSSYIYMHIHIHMCCGKFRYTVRRGTLRALAEGPLGFVFLHGGFLD